MHNMFLTNMSNSTPAADLTDTAASLALDDELAFLVATADRAQQDRAEAPGPAEEILSLLCAASLALRAAEATSAAARSARLLLVETLCLDAARTLSTWRISSGCEDWRSCLWTAEVIVCAEVQAQLDTLRARLLRASADPELATRLASAAA